MYHQEVHVMLMELSKTLTHCFCRIACENSESSGWTMRWFKTWLCLDAGNIIPQQLEHCIKCASLVHRF